MWQYRTALKAEGGTGAEAVVAVHEEGPARISERVNVVDARLEAWAASPWKICFPWKDLGRDRMGACLVEAF